ncbi:unnamed protein product [Phytophthora lilii]|uniref:Unnamed protein product n=1 Tax=Phytophthora lilii TaxID=2077276 RepID=A0A9W6YJL2_9STRA|nr:unnamed protein product [Phytophthora lilii]
MSAWMSTPSVVVDEKRLRTNISRMQALAAANKVQLRPHIKTHKTAEIAQLQLEAGACGITVSKPSEALEFFRAGIPSLRSILLAYPVIDSRKLKPLVEASKQFGIEFLLTVDSSKGIDAVEEAALQYGHPVKLLIHVDVGYHRVGVDKDDPCTLEMAKRIQQSHVLRFAGILSHAGMLVI